MRNDRPCITHHEVHCPICWPDAFNIQRHSDEMNRQSREKYGTPASRIVEDILDGKRRKDGVILRDYTSAERKEMPIVTGVLKYFPDAIAAISRVSKKSNTKHNGPDAPLGWTRNISSDHEDCIGRHALAPDAIDADSGEMERAHRAWRDLADLQIAEEKRLIAAGIKPLSGVVT